MSSGNFANFLNKFGVVLLVTCAPSWAIPPHSIPWHFLPYFTRNYLVFTTDFQTFPWTSKFQICLIFWLSLGLLTRLCALPAELYPRIQFPQKFFELPKSISSIFSFNRAYFRTNHPICQLANFAEFWPDSKFPLGTFTGVLGLPAELYPHIQFHSTFCWTLP